MRARIRMRDYEQLSAYIDGQLTPNERRKMEERLRARPDLQVVLEEINRTRTLIRAVPRRRAPRNFTLTPAMVEDLRAGRKPGSIFNLFPALSFASALATLALVATLVLDLVPGLMPSGTPYSQPAAVALEAPIEEQAGEIEEIPVQKQAAPQEEAAPPMGAPAAGLETSSPETLQTEQVERAVLESPSPASDLLPEPPVITWSDPNAPQGEVTGIVGMGGGDYAPFPNAYGKGGGGDGISPGSVGVEGGLPSGGLILPLEAAESIGPIEIAPEEQSVLAPPGGGPVLGLPSTEEAGQIEIASAFGEPLSSADAGTGLAVEPPMGPVERQVEETGLPGSEAQQPKLRLVQVLLALVAVITGAAAFLVRSNRARF